MKKDLLYLSPERLLTHPQNLRRFYQEEHTQAMAASIRACKGVLQALRVVSSGQDGKFHVVDGNLRLAGARLLGKECPPLKCEVVNESEAQQHLAMVITAKFRFDPDPVSEAIHYKRLMEEDGYSVREIAALTGLHMRTIEGRLKLLELEPEIQELIAQKKLSADQRATDAFLSISNKKARVKLAERLSKDSVTIKALMASCERLAARMEQAARGDQETGAIPLAIKKAGRKPAPEVKVPLKAVKRAAADICKACQARESAIKKAPEPAWAIVERAANCTCTACNIREVDGVCKSCPAVELIRRLIEING